MGMRLLAACCSQSAKKPLERRTRTKEPDLIVSVGASWSVEHQPPGCDCTPDELTGPFPRSAQLRRELLLTQPYLGVEHLAFASPKQFSDDNLNEPTTLVAHQLWGPPGHFPTKPTEDVIERERALYHHNLLALPPQQWYRQHRESFVPVLAACVCRWRALQSDARTRCELVRAFPFQHPIPRSQQIVKSLRVSCFF